MSLELRYHVTLDAALRQELTEVYAEVRAPLLHLPNYGIEAFAGRLDRHLADPGFGIVLGYEGGQPVGYAYGNTVGARDPYWQRLAEPLAEGGPTVPALAIKEIGVRPPWRGTGAARRIHDGLLAERTEETVMLMVNPLAGDGKVQRVYESWGYRRFNSQSATAASPELAAMVRPNRPA
ncbi:acetyltransferase [Kitasatospora sp. MMS16-BH015]|uniref:GNAT family N-acetyltransferase n=1 Tax=Kitasatospora sp. MMS16-BH015 TaxID=2018025 RepID=UPI000CA3A49D|nr:GNAT family N-acetyltransferase [Kitasatospora sp. MMS16-BH015]AUG80916.1 acetyltransferase [Kitasatospora sp. MMS16-BH015]